MRRALNFLFYSRPKRENEISKAIPVKTTNQKENDCGEKSEERQNEEENVQREKTKKEYRS
jgi:hypothetical protein